MNDGLIEKYQGNAPRYTSFPPVPAWNKEAFTISEFHHRLLDGFNQSKNSNRGVSVYIHLPFCESLCTYCGCHTRITKNHSVEKTYISYVLKEWTKYTSFLNQKPVIEELHLGGGTPSFFSPENLKMLIDGISMHAVLSPTADLSFEGHPGNTTVEHLKTLYNLGFRRVSFGVQDFSPHVQQIINRKQSFDDVKYVVNNARSIGYLSINIDLIYGLPGQNKQTMDATLDAVKKLNPDRIAFYSYAHVPWLKPAQKSFSPEIIPNGSVKQELYEKGRSFFLENGYRDIGMDHFAKPDDALFIALNNKSLHRNFMGYTTRKTDSMIGLGVSSISDVGKAYAQNEKSVEEYYKKIDNDEWPIITGHLHTEFDLFIRKHILNLICFGETEWKSEDASFFKNPEIMNKWIQMEIDGLISIQKNKVSITHTGHRFIRNICAVIDPTLNSIQSTKPVYSTTV